MKRILTLLCLALALVSCKKEDKERNLNESDILGVWFCTEWHSEGIDGDSRVSIVVTQDHKMDLRFPNEPIRTRNWALNGNQLEIDREESPVAPAIIVNEIDGKHMKWTIVYPNEEKAFCTFFNLSRILPGEWTFDSEGMGSYDMSIDASGTSSWTREGETPMEVNWEILFVTNDPIPHIRILGVNVDLTDTFTVVSVADNRIELLSAGDVTVVLQRK